MDESIGVFVSRGMKRLDGTTLRSLNVTKNRMSGSVGFFSTSRSPLMSACATSAKTSIGTASRSTKSRPTWSGSTSDAVRADGAPVRRGLGGEADAGVAVAIYACHAGRGGFMRGYDAMLEHIRPSAIICYGEPFAEMRGNVIAVPMCHPRCFPRTLLV